MHDREVLPDDKGVGEIVMDIYQAAARGLVELESYSQLAGWNPEPLEPMCPKWGEDDCPLNCQDCEFCQPSYL